MPDYIYNRKRLAFHAGDYTFRSVINEVIQTGFKADLKEDAESGEGEEQEVGQFDEKSCKIIRLEILGRKTSPRKEFSQDTLLAFMENPRNEKDEKLIGLGTPATRSGIIKNLFDRGYIREDRKKLYATSKGLFLLKQLKKDAKLGRIADPGETTLWEKQLREDPEGFKESIIRYLRSCVKQGDRETYTRGDIGRCPLCGKPVTEGRKNYYCAGYKSTPPCKFMVWKEVAGTAVSPADIKLLLSGKPTPVKKLAAKSGKLFSAALVLNKEGKVIFRFPEKKPYRPPAAKTKKG
jgi:DNA topoisomerase-3